ncbi:GGDEF domain-containing protein [Lachnospiraceae bacterium LCP25S3_G4]
MFNYILALSTSSVINIIMLLLLLYLVGYNTIMTTKKTNTYLITIIITIIVIITELCTIIFDTLGPEYRLPNIIANIVGFSLSACIPYLLAVVLDETLYKNTIYFYIPLLLNALLYITSPWTGLAFSISPNNAYERGPFFIFYVITYLLGLLLLVITNYHQWTKFQNTEYVFLLILCSIILVGTTVQVLIPHIHSSWHCITLVLVMYYLFQREMQFKYDTVTQLLNRPAFEKQLEILKEKNDVYVILFDVDMFKHINDTYSHIKGDYYLRLIAQIIKKSFQSIGYSYRIGGDEFCVLASRVEEDAIYSCISSMLHYLDLEREKDSIVPTISYGYSQYNKADHLDILDVFRNADENMYSNKKIKHH